jgi:hypothetical protein
MKNVKEKLIKIFRISACLVVIDMISLTMLQSQSLGVNTDGSAPDASTLLHVKSSNKGILIPNVALSATNDATTIALPATSLMVYNTGTGGLTPAGYYYNSGTTGTPNWVRLFSGGESSDWKLTGNSGTNSTSSFIGTIDAVDFVVRTNNTEKFRVTSSGFTGIGTATPGAKLDVNGKGRFGSASRNVVIGDTSNMGYVNFNTSFGTLGYGFRDSAGVLEYKHSGGIWAAFAQPPTIPGNIEWWVRPTDSLYIQPMHNSNAKVYDAGQTWAFYYNGTNVKGSFLAGGDVGVVMHRSGVSSTSVPKFAGDQFPFVDVNSDAEITSADVVTYTGGYAYGSLYNGFTGISKWDAGVRGIGLGITDGTNSSWPVTGVIGEVLYTGSGDLGQQGIYGWQAAPAGTAVACSGIIGRTSQTGNQSAGVVGYYTSSVGNLTTCFTSFKSIGMLGLGTKGVYGQTSAVGGVGVFGANTDLTSASNVGVYGLVGDGTSQSIDFKAILGVSNNTNDLYGCGGYFSGEYYGVYAINPTASSGYAIYYSGNLAGTGTKSCVMKTSQGPKALYCVESPENYLEDYGTAQMVNGTARIDIDPVFLETITIDGENPYKVFIQMIDEISNNIHIKKYDTYFEVIENNGGTSNATFDWRFIAKRKGFEKLRLAEVPEAYSDPALYPDPNDASIPEKWRQKVQDYHAFLKYIKNVPIVKQEEVKPKSRLNKRDIENNNQ